MVIVKPKPSAEGEAAAFGRTFAEGEAASANEKSGRLH
jgi:hypothetical protein